MLRLLRRIGFEVRYALLSVGIYPRYEMVVYHVDEDEDGWIIADSIKPIHFSCWTARGVMRMAGQLADERHVCHVSRVWIETVNGERCITNGDAAWVTKGRHVALGENGAHFFI